jgi:hypothetical protein
MTLPSCTATSTDIAWSLCRLIVLREGLPVRLMLPILGLTFSDALLDYTLPQSGYRSQTVCRALPRMSFGMRFP